MSKLRPTSTNSNLPKIFWFCSFFRKQKHVMVSHIFLSWIFLFGKLWHDFRTGFHCCILIYLSIFSLFHFRSFNCFPLFILQSFSYFSCFVCTISCFSIFFDSEFVYFVLLTAVTFLRTGSSFVHVFCFCSHKANATFCMVRVFGSQEKTPREIHKTDLVHPPVDRPLPPPLSSAPLLPRPSRPPSQKVFLLVTSGMMVSNSSQCKPEQSRFRRVQLQR